MGRWEPDAEDRFRAAAIELFGEVGFEHTTVAAIAQRAGLTSRTFFRYFTDKREVLFNGSELLLQTMVDGVAAAPDGATPMAAVTAALVKTGEFFNETRRPLARARHAVIVANPELLERELMKMATLSATLTDALMRRGVPDEDARLTAETGIAVFRLAFAQWVEPTEARSYTDLVHFSFTRLKALLVT